MNMHQRKNQETEIVQTMGALSAGEKRQRPAREHVEREEVQEVVDFVFGRHAVVEALQTPDRVNRVFIQEGTSGRDAAKVIELAREKGIQVQTVPKTKIEDLGRQCRSPRTRGFDCSL